MIGQVNNNTTSKKRPFSAFKNAPQVKRAYLSYRYHNTEAADTKTKIKSLAGALIGTAMAAILIAKGQHLNLANPINIFKIKYSLKDMAVMSGLSIAGGVAAGMIGSNRKKEKLNEGIFQFINATLPPLLVVPVLKGIEQIKSLKNNNAVKISATIATLIAGMKAGTVLSNTITDPHDKIPDRKLTMKDAIANADDALGALAVAKFPMMDKAEKILPVIYTWCGYRAGQSN